MTRYDLVWVAYRDGDPRRYASATPFSREFAASLVRQGFEILQLAYRVPDSATRKAAALAPERVNPLPLGRQRARQKERSGRVESYERVTGKRVVRRAR